MKGTSKGNNELILAKALVIAKELIDSQQKEIDSYRATTATAVSNRQKQFTIRYIDAFCPVTFSHNARAVFEYIVSNLGTVKGCSRMDWSCTLVESNQILTTYSNIGEATGLNFRKAERAVHLLEKERFINLKTTNTHSLITVIKSDKYIIERGADYEEIF